MVAQVIFILLDLSLRLSYYEKVKFSLKMELQTGTPLVLSLCKILFKLCSKIVSLSFSIFIT